MCSTDGHRLADLVEIGIFLMCHDHNYITFYPNSNCTSQETFPGSLDNHSISTDSDSPSQFTQLLHELMPRCKTLMAMPIGCMSWAAGVEFYHGKKQ
jgi:hypothetical protein